MKTVKFEGVGFNAADVVSTDVEAFITRGMAVRWFRTRKTDEKKAMLRRVYALCQKEMGVKESKKP